MAGAYIPGNEIDDDATITPSTEDSDYPAENLYDRQAAKVFKCTSLTTLTILIDFGAAIAANSIGIINHNFTSGVSISLKADNFSPPTTVRVSPAYRQYDIWAPFTDPAARYFLLTITDTNTEELQIGQLVIATRVALPRARRIGQGYRPMRRRSNLSAETYAGVFWNYNLFTRYHFNPTFRIGSAAELATLRALDNSVYGNLYPFVYIPGSAGTECYYVRKDESFEPVEVNRIAGGELAHDYVMSLTEESRGLEILA